MSDRPTPTFPEPRIEWLCSKAALPKGGGSIDLLLRTSVDFPDAELDRPPLQIALVIDRSGSMSGAPLEAAKGAAVKAVEMLLPGDRVAVVSFESSVRVEVPLVLVEEDRGAILQAIRRIGPAGSTALHAGWVEGTTQVLSHLDPAAVMRVVLLTDGHANQGLSEAAGIAADVAEAVRHGVSTSAMGFGLSYDEDLLRAVADAGQGNYVFIEGASQVAEAFQLELAGLSALRGRRLRIRPDGQGMVLRHAASGMGEEADGLVLPDLLAGLRSETLLTLRLEADARPVLLLAWEDVLSGRREQRRIELELPWLEAAAYQAMPWTEEVLHARRLIELAEFKERIRAASIRRDLGAAKEEILGAGTVLKAMPAGPERQREERELRRLEQMLEQHDLDRMKLYAGQTAMAHKRSRSDLGLRSMAVQEASWREQKMEKIRQLGQRTKKEKPAEKAAAKRPADAGRSDAAVGQLLFASTIAQADGGSSRIEVVLGDLTDQPLDVIVNTSNRGLFGLSGVDGAIHRRGGPELTAACKAIGGIDHGQAVFTPGFALPARFVVHTAAMPWRGDRGEMALLRRCYLSSLELAVRLGASSVGLPAIGTGSHGYPKAEAARVAVFAVLGFLRQRRLDLVRFVLWDAAAGEDYRRELAAAALASRTSMRGSSVPSCGP